MWISHRSLELEANWPKNRTENQRTETMSWQKQQKALCFGEGETDVLHDQKAAFNLPFPYRFISLLTPRNSDMYLSSAISLYFWRGQEQDARQGFKGGANQTKPKPISPHGLNGSTSG